jgi:hypothetical protein
MAMDLAIARIYCIKWFAYLNSCSLPHRQDGDRAESDWERARQIVDESPILARSIAVIFSDEAGYGTFVRERGNPIARSARTMFGCDWFPTNIPIIFLPDQEIDFAIMHVFCVKRFARIVAETMASKETGETRAVTDWVEAEKIIAARPSIVDAMAKNGRRRFTDEDGYETFVRQEGEAFWNNARGLRHLLPRPPYTHATFS